MDAVTTFSSIRRVAPLALLIALPTAEAAGSSVGKLSAVVGKAEIQREGQTIKASRGMEIFPADLLVTTPRTAVKIQFLDGSSFMAFENSSVKIEDYQIKAGNGKGVSVKSAFDIAKGKVRFFVKPKEDGNTNDVAFKTANAVMGIRGTSGVIDASQPGRTQLVVLTGKVEVSNPSNPNARVFVTANQMTDVVGSRPPVAPKVVPPQLLKQMRSEPEVSADASPKEGDPAKPGTGEKRERNDTPQGDEAKPTPESGEGAKATGGDAGSGEASQAKDTTEAEGPKSASNEKKEGQMNAAPDKKEDQKSAGSEKREEPKPSVSEKKEETQQAVAEKKKDEPKPRAASTQEPEKRAVPSASDGSKTPSVEKSATDAPRMEKKIVFTPDGQSAVVVTGNAGLQRMAAPPPVIAPLLVQGSQPSALKSLQTQAQQITTVTSAIEQRVTSTFETQRQVVTVPTAAPEPVRKTIRVRVQLPTMP